jgi:hypothetical protein
MSSNNKDQEDLLDNKSKTTEKESNPVMNWQVQVMGISLLVLALVLAYLFLMIWPAGMSPTADGASIVPVHLFGDRLVLQLSLDVRLVLVVMIAGGLGSFIHTATSFSDYVGNGTLSSSWLWWYIFRPFVGMMLAVVFYLAVRGGFLTGPEAGKINPFGIAALAGLVGMFSKQATDKLDEIFNTLFRTAPGAGDSKRQGSLTNPRPSINDWEPKSIEPQTESLIVTVIGTGFVKGAAVRVNGTNRETHFESESRLTATLLPDDVEKEGEVELTVFSPGPGGGMSTPIKLKIARKP